MTGSPWYERFFGEDYLQAYRPILPEKDAEKEAEFVIGRLGLRPGMKVLDLCCGQGRHAVPLARRGIQVTGLDLSERLLDEARRAAGAAGVALDLHRADMREIPWTAEFDAAINLYTAFGYFEDDRENFRVLEGVARALKPGGRFCIDIVNPAFLFRHWIASGWTRGDGGLLVLQERRMDWTRGIQETDWTFIEPDGRRREISTRLRLVHPHELAAWLERAGLRVEALLGDHDGQPLDVDRFRLIAIARKP